MKNKSRIVMLLAGVAVSATAIASAYAQNAGGNQPGQGNMQNCQIEQGAGGQAPCGPQGAGPQGFGQQGMGQPGAGPQAMDRQGMGPRDGDQRGMGHGKWGGRQMASNEYRRHGQFGMGQRGMGERGMGERGMGQRGGQGAGNEGPGLMFQRADKDNSGTVTLEEFAAASPFTFTGADADGDGNVTAQELADKMQRDMLLRRAERMIERFDTDNDGQVSAAEIENRQQQMFARMDVDGSGTIEQDELRVQRGGMRGHDDDGRRGGDSQRRWHRFDN